MTSQVAHSGASRGPKPSGHPSTSHGGGTVLPELRSSDHAIDKSKPLPTSLQSDFIPEELLMALVQPAPPYDKLGPPNRYRNLSTTVANPRRPADNLWNNPRQRQKFKHLTDNPPCVCGAGKDVSFLYDVPKEEKKPEEPSKHDPSGARVQQLDEDEQEEPTKKKLALPESLIPEEYHIVKNKGVLGLEYHEDKFATQPEDHEKHLVLFPSMKPVSRFEVQQLKKTMENMLAELKITEDMKTDGPTQMHNLLGLIKKEQDIYNLIFHELIRQVSVECTDRGALLSELRTKYSLLLNKVPSQVKGLHEEVLAQRALDRRLTEELMRFKHTIVSLTEELKDVKEHDTVVTAQATSVQRELRDALIEASKNASLLEEYHELYELQRQRLQNTVATLSTEKEIWSSAAYSLALKVTEESKLNTAKRLHVAEKAWVKLANHFTIFLSDKDTETLTELQSYMDRFRDLLDEFNRYLCGKEDHMREQLGLVKKGINQWYNYFRKYILSKDGHLVRALDTDRLLALYENLREWEQVIARLSEEFSGDMFLAGEESVRQIRRQVDGWSQAAIQVFSRHHVDPNAQHPDHEFMLRMNDNTYLEPNCNNPVVENLPKDVDNTLKGHKLSYKWIKPMERSYDERCADMKACIAQNVERLLRQYSVRMTGENGVATGLIHLSNSLDTWLAKLQAALHSTAGTTSIPDQEWLRFYQLLDDWQQVVDETSNAVGFPLKEGEKIEGLEEGMKPLEVGDVMKATQSWLVSTTNGIDSEDSKLVENVSALHTDMVQWMVQVLLRLAPDQEGHSEEAKAAVLQGSAPIPVIKDNCTSICQRIFTFSTFVTRYVQEYYDQFVNNIKNEMMDLKCQCCNDFVAADVQARLERQEEGAEKEQQELVKLMNECKDWIMTARVLLSELTGEPVPEGLVLPATAQNQQPPPPLPQQLPDRLDVEREKTALSAASLASAEVARQLQGWNKLFANIQKDIRYYLRMFEEESPQSVDSQEKTMAAPADSTDPAEPPELMLQRPSEEPTPMTSGTSQQPIGQDPSPPQDSPPAPPAPRALHILGPDANTHTQPLEERAGAVSSAARSGSDGGGATPRTGTPALHPVLAADGAAPLTPNTRKAYEALSAVGELQQQLIMTEERAQSAEERVLSMEAELKDAAERIRELERQVAKTPEELEASVAQTKSLLQPQSSTATTAALTPTASGTTGLTPAPSTTGAAGTQRAASHNTLLSPARGGSGSSVGSESSQKRPKSRGGKRKK